MCVMKKDNVLSLMVLGGKWSVTGFLTTFKSFSGPFTPLIESLWRSWTSIEISTRDEVTISSRGKYVPIKPLNLLKVLGMRT
jgi:hypothetical protein